MIKQLTSEFEELVSLDSPDRKILEEKLKSIKQIEIEILTLVEFNFPENEGERLNLVTEPILLKSSIFLQR